MITRRAKAPDAQVDHRSRLPRPSGWPGPALLLGIVLLAGSGRTVAQVPPPSIDALIAKAARQGTLRVLVELKMDPSAPPTRESIAAAQDLVLQGLAGTSHRVLRRFTTIPFVGLEVSADALRRLGNSAGIVGIREDRILRPQGAPSSP